MHDPRLNSVHLDFPRRDDFRRAREALLEARGLHTLAVENHEDLLSRGASGTIRQSQRDSIPPHADYWLKDHQGVYPLKVGVNTIGRLPDNDVVIQGPYVSRRHCAILIHVGQACEVYDIASKNGTYVNGLRLCGPTQLAAGDEIRMCDRHFTFMSKSAAGDQAGHGSTQAED
jgi:pSer/pThr/pTyr-binding forkhead associated (FHA) protein